MTGRQAKSGNAYARIWGEGLSYFNRRCGAWTPAQVSREIKATPDSDRYVFLARVSFLKSLVGKPQRHKVPNFGEGSPFWLWNPNDDEFNHQPPSHAKMIHSVHQVVQPISPCLVPPRLFLERELPF